MLSQAHQKSRKQIILQIIAVLFAEIAKKRYNAQETLKENMSDTTLHTLSESFLSAKKRHQPYINLTNKLYTLADLLSENSFKEYKELELKSLYFRTEKLKLDKEFGEGINKLTDAGIKEIFVFCHQEDSQLNPQQLNDFLKTYGIRINLKIAQITHAQLDNIGQDSIGKKDLLGFVSLINNKITYQDGLEINLLNDAITDRAILDNFAGYKQIVASKHKFVAEEPEYITSSENSNPDKRIKTLDKTGDSFALESQLQLEISKNIDLSLGVEVGVEEENELDLDIKQAENKFNQAEASEQAHKLFLTTFYEHYVEIEQQREYATLYNPYEFTSNLVDNLFKSDPQISYISSKALDLMVKNYFLFQEGINLKNMPIGLAFKNTIVFASDQRLSSMPINDFTIKLDNVQATISSPLKYSWLHFATKASISLNDVYGTVIAPRLNSEIEHPAVKRMPKLEDKMLDFPANQYFSKFKVDKINEEVNFAHDFDRKGFKYKGEVKLSTFTGFPDEILFPDLTESDKKQLTEIRDNLENRGILQIFCKIINTNYIHDGGFLLEEEATLFFEKLFKEIFPLGEDNKKLNFFQQVLATHTFKENSNIEDVFEGLNGCYKKFQAFLIKEEITDSEVQKNLEIHFLATIKNQIKETNSFKVITERVISVIELAMDRGVNLIEQMEYLSDHDTNSLLKGPHQYLKAKEFGLNTLHKSAELDSWLSYEYDKAPSLDGLLKQLTETSIHENDSYRDQLLVSSLRYLATVQPHQRPSIDTYAKFYVKLPFERADQKSICFSRSKDYHQPEIIDAINQNKKLHTVEYYSSKILSLAYHIFSPEAEVTMYFSNKPALELVKTGEDLPAPHMLLLINGNDLYLKYAANEQSGIIKLVEQEGREDGIQTAISRLQKYIGLEGQVVQVDQNNQELQNIGSYLDGDMLNDHPGLMEVFAGMAQGQAHKTHNELYIKHNDTSYDLYIYKPGGEDVVINKSQSTLPVVLEERIKEWYENGKIGNSIKLTASEVAGTIFEDFANYAHKNSVDELVNLADLNLATLRENLANAPKEPTKNPCFIATPLIAENANLVTNYTAKQASENVRLLSLNILSSTGKYYNKLYPDQEFSGYVSLFNSLFSDVKVYEELEVNEYEYEGHEDFDRKVLYVVVTPPPLKPMRNDIDVKEKQHKKMVDTFINTFKQNPEFNFGQAVALGLVANLDKSLGDKVIENAKVLLQYNEHFTQLLRVLLSTKNSDAQGIEEIKARAQSIANNINYLLQKVIKDDKEIAVHELLTESAEHPENIVFFAACFGRQTNVTTQQIEDLLVAIKKLEPGLKEALLDSFAHTKLPFDYGQIVTDSNFPAITLNDLENPNQLNAVIQKAALAKASYANETRFNNVSLDKKQFSKVDLTPLETKYKIELPSKFKDKSYAELKKEILKDKVSIEYQILGDNADKTLTQNIALEIATSILESLSNHESGWQTEAKKTATLLFNSDKSLQHQLQDIEQSKRNLEFLLRKGNTTDDRDAFLDSLLRAPKLPHDIIKQTLEFLNTIDPKALEAKNYTLTKLLNSASNELIGKHFEAFKIATEFFVTSNVGVSLTQLYKFIEQISGIDDSTSSAKKLINYCIKHADYSVIDIMSKLNCKLDNIDKIVDLITHISPQDIRKLNANQYLNFAKLFKIKDGEKIGIITDIALKLDDQLQNSAYKIVSKITANDLAYAKLLKSYLLAPASKDLTKPEQIKLILDNLDSLENAQVIFSEHNLKRFHYSESRLITKIQEMKHKYGEANDDRDLLLVEQKELYKCFIIALEKAKAYKDFTTNDLHDQSIELKRMHKLHKDSTLVVNRDIDLEFVALSLELMYRETGKFPRDTQVLSILNTMIHSDHLIQEVATGQGKSIITALHASYLWYTGQTVDVVTSNKYLAAKDLQEFSSYYSNLGIDHAEYIISADSEVKEYKKGGINYSIPSDLALFRADREFYSNKFDPSLQTDASLVCDEVDAALTSEVNYKLAIPLIYTNQEQTRALFDSIIDFAATNAFQNNQVARKDDIKNLELYLRYQFQKYDSSYIYPLSVLQLHDLKLSINHEAKKLYALHQALFKCSKDSDNIFDVLLDSVVVVKQLRKGMDYVILREDLENTEQLLRATPIIKDQPSKGTMFGNGVQAFLHLMIEREHPELQQRFDVSPPTSTIFNVSPKNFFDHYKLTGGRIIGLTGTAGNKHEIEEFREANKMLAYSVPRFEDDKKVVIETEASNSNEQFEKVLGILQEKGLDRPVIIFCDNTKEAEKVFIQLLPLKPNLQLCASSANDTGSIQKVVTNAGTNGYITVTTPMLGRGTDFFTSNENGFLAINLCTDITYSSLKQIQGRVARNGAEGEVISVFNHEHYNETIAIHMDKLSLKQKELRMKSQPLTDILKYFNTYNHDNAVNAIRCNEFITKAWYRLLKENHKASVELQKSYFDLRNDLVAIVKLQYPHVTQNLDGYLRRIDAGVPTKIESYSQEIPLANITEHIDAFYSANDKYQAKSFQAIETTFTEQCDINALGKLPLFSKLNQPYSVSYVIQPSTLLSSSDTVLTPNRLKNLYENEYSLVSMADYTARSVPIEQLEIPTENNSYRAFYNTCYHANLAVMYTHVFYITEVDFQFFDTFNYKIVNEKSIARQIDYREMQFFINQNKKLYCKIRDKNELEIKIGQTPEIDGILQTLYNKILTNDAGEIVKLTATQKLAMNKFLLQNNYISEHKVKAEGSFGTLMLPEFKKSFAGYKQLVNSKEVDKMSGLVDNFLDIKEIEVNKLALGKYQAINITTKFNTQASHAESIITDGKFLLWINRGEDDTESGIKVFRIIKNLEQVKEIFNQLKQETLSQADTRKVIFTLLREEFDKEMPEHILIKMDPQTIGNCTWMQTKSMMKAIALVGRIGNLTDLPDENSPEWQKALKDSDDIYKDFTTYDRIIRTEALIYSLDKSFKPQFLSVAEQAKINARRDAIDEPVSQELLEKMVIALESNVAKVANSIFERQAHSLLDIIKLEAAVGSEMGIALQSQYNYDQQSVKDLLAHYQNNKLNDFQQLELIYRNIKEGRIEEKLMQDAVFNKVIQYINDNSYYIYNKDQFIEQLNAAIKECTTLQQANETCVITHFDEKISGEELIGNDLLELVA